MYGLHIDVMATTRLNHRPRDARQPTFRHRGVVVITVTIWVWQALHLMVKIKKRLQQHSYSVCADREEERYVVNIEYRDVMVKELHQGEANY